MSTVERGEEDRKDREGNGGERISCSLPDSEDVSWADDHF